jgi:hypothetical protein
MCVMEPELPVKQIAVCTLTDICKHSDVLAQRIVDLQALQKISPLLRSTDAKLKMQVLAFFAQIAKHSSDLASLVASQLNGKLL